MYFLFATNHIYRMNIYFIMMKIIRSVTKPKNFAEYRFLNEIGIITTFHSADLLIDNLKRNTFFCK